VLEAAEGSPLHAYVVLSLLAGLRTEELRSLPWSDVDLDARTVAVFRSVRASGETKTPKSRRVLSLPVKLVVLAPPAPDLAPTNRDRQCGCRKAPRSGGGTVTPNVRQSR